MMDIDRIARHELRRRMAREAAIKQGRGRPDMLMINQLSGFGAGGDPPLPQVMDYNSARQAVGSVWGCGIPAGAVYGDILIQAVLVKGTTANVWNSRTGWSNQVLLTVGASSDKLWIDTAVYSGSTAAGTTTYSSGTYESRSVMIAIRNATLDVIGSATADTATAASITTTAANSIVVGIYGSRSGSSGAQAITPPSGFTESVEEVDFNAGYQTLEACWKMFISAGATGTQAATISSTASFATLLSVKPNF